MSGSGSASLHLLCLIGGSTVAFPAAEIEAVVSVDAIVPVPGAPSMVRGLAAMRSRLLTVLDCPLMVGAPHERAGLMAVITVAGHGYGLLIDDVVDVVELTLVEPLPGRPDAAWQKLQPMLADHHGEPVLVVDPSRFVDMPRASFPHAA
ncbi:chemotaxis protein CheW [Sphingomonas lacunae]|uniref:Chemotaxis protein CheW n=1 Tax=Sphingomonas lacunae TaxID=2698828 RepID=A0A6M4AV87_9SPHN|nr:chemotaxis protein CheW [Sphingomonas lacunae]QJQ32974.1 chemotaxis protein CheW [Sphingomonas lacunae]